MNLERILRLLPLIACTLLFYSCQKPIPSPANLVVNNIEFEETFSAKYLDLPNGSFMPDNPDFNINNSETWTGNMAQYVKHNRFYTVSYQISNTGGSTAYDTEIDLYYLFSNGNEEVETISIGNIYAHKNVNSSIEVATVNKELMEASAEVFWYD